MGFSSLPKSSLHSVTAELSSQDASIVRKASLPITDFIRAFDIRIEQLTPKQFEFFLAARALLPLVERLQIPVATTSDQGAAPLYVAQPEDSRRSYATDTQKECSPVPTEHISIGRAELRDLPYVLPHQLCYPREQLVRMLVNGQLARRVMLRHETGDDVSGMSEDRTPKDAGYGTESERRQRAYLLLDVSQSMNGDIPPGGSRPDKRGSIARGLSLAFLCVAHERDSLLYLRPFSSAVGERVSGAHPQELIALTKDVLSIPNAGSTALQASLEAAAADLDDFRSEARVDVMLITDGVSWLSVNPLAGRHLHTFLIGNSCVERHAGESVLKKLTGWSSSFNHVKDEEFDAFLTLRSADLCAVVVLIERALEKAPYCASLSELAEVENLLAIGAACLELRDGSAGNMDYRGCLETLVQRGKEMFSSSTLRSEVASRQAQFERLCDLYDGNLPSGFRRLAMTARSTSEKCPLDASIHLGASGTGHGGGLSLLLRVVYHRIKTACISIFSRQHTPQSASTDVAEPPRPPFGA